MSIYPEDLTRSERDVVRALTRPVFRVDDRWRVKGGRKPLSSRAVAGVVQMGLARVRDNELRALPAGRRMREMIRQREIVL